MKQATNMEDQNCKYDGKEIIFRWTVYYKIN